MLLKGIAATTHVDRQREKLPKEALDTLAHHVNSRWLPTVYNHDPRHPVIGRSLSAQVVELPDGEHGVEITQEIYEPGEKIATRSDRRYEPRENEGLYIGFDFSRRDAREDQEVLAEIARLMGTDAPRYEAKKAIEPLSVLTLGAVFVLGGIAAGFLNKMGSDAWDATRAGVKKLMGRKRGDEQLIVFDFDVMRFQQRLKVKVVITNPTDEELEWAMTKGMEELDEYLIRNFDRLRASGVVECTATFEHQRVSLLHGVTIYCTPVYPREPRP